MTNGNLVLTILTAVFSAIMLLPILKQLQSTGYSPKNFFKTSRYFVVRYLPFFAIGAAFAAVYPIGLLFKDTPFNFAYAILYFAAQLLAVVKYFGKVEKTSLRFTPRLSRLAVLSEIFATLTAAHIATEFAGGLNGLAAFLAPLSLPVFALVADCLLYPFELINNKRYIRLAKRALNDNPYLIKIGITGSFGKTSVKNILKAMLENKYNVVATEGNYNTPLGIAKSVKNIDSYTEVFIAEMGARKVGDVSELVDIVAPQYGIVTGVTGQHLETFKTIDNVYLEKFKLIESLPKDGYGVVNRNGIERYVALPPNCEYVGDSQNICSVTDVKPCADGSEFTLILDCKRYSAKTRLLGAHNLQNIATAAAVAYKLHVSPEKIVKAIASLKGVPHRLQPIKNGGITIIDDTYNANPVGVREALAVLTSFGGRKIVVTPGMVELGNGEVAENRKFGEQIAACADLVLLIGGTRVHAVRDGLINNGFDDEKILNYKTLAAAEREFPKLFREGDVVMFINDLPDIYG